MNALGQFGLILEGLGVIVAVWGVHVRFREAEGDGHNEWDPLTASLSLLARRGWHSVETAFRRVLRRPRSAQHVTGSGMIVQGAGSVRARGRVGYGRVTLSNHELALHELARRTQELSGRVADVRDHADDEIERLEAALGDLRQALLGAIVELREEHRRVASADVRVQLVGLGIVGVGIMLQALSFLVL